MFKFSHLWQRIFAWAILLIVASHAVSFLLFKTRFDDYDFKQRLIERSTELASELEGGSFADIRTASDFVNRKEARFWVEQPDGTLIAGEFIFEKQTFPTAVPLLGNATTVLRSPSHEALYITATPFRTQEGPAVMYLAGRRQDTSPILRLFYQGFITVLILGGALSAWVAWRISQPLSKLCEEVLHIADGHLDRRVSITGKEEVAQVAAAVNQLTGSLEENINKLHGILANFSHEMRSPLTRMNVSLAIIEEGLAPPEKPAEIAAPHDKTMLAAKHVHSMQKEIDHMERLIGSSLLTNKLALLQQEVQLVPVALSELCTEMIRRHEPLMHSKGISVTRTIQSDLWVKGDESLLCMVLSNLLDNATKYTDEGGEVRCALCLEQKMIRFTVENSHEPIAKEDLAAIFDPFYRGLGTGYDDGVGLGLALVEKIVTIHKGSVTAKNSETGLLFTIQLTSVERPGL